MREYTAAYVHSDHDKTDKHTSHMNSMARVGWRLVSTSAVGWNYVLYFWEREQKQ